jgi:glucose/arabinose dehydrogenase
MKNKIRNMSGLAFLGVMLFATNITHAQTAAASTTTTSTTQSAGTISQFSPDTIAVQTTSSAAPVSYSYSKTTTYVDQNGSPVSMDIVKSGVPVTVYYTQEGDQMMASKVVVQSTSTSNAPSAPVSESQTSATTTSTAAPPAGLPPTVDGVVTDADSGHIDLRTSSSSLPVHYKAHDSTAYVDGSGSPVSRKNMTKGTPVTIYYEQHGDDLFATRVVLRNPAVLDR